MRDYIIMTDSCCDLPAELVSELELTVLPLSFCIEGRELYNFPDNREMDPKVFYEKLRNGAEGTTYAINVGVFQTEMARIASEGRDILCISFSSGLSTTYQSACIAAKTVMEEFQGCTVTVVDSLPPPWARACWCTWRSRRSGRAGLWRRRRRSWSGPETTSATGSQWTISTTSSGADGSPRRRRWWVPCCR